MYTSSSDPLYRKKEIIELSTSLLIPVTICFVDLLLEIKALIFTESQQHYNVAYIVLVNGLSWICIHVQYCKCKMCSVLFTMLVNVLSVCMY